MGSTEEKRSMAHFVQAQHIKTREKLARRVIFPVPKIGDIIVYNEQQRYHEKHDPDPKRGVGIVKAVYGCNIVIEKMHMREQFFNVSIRTIDFELGLYTFVELEKLPVECPRHAELEIGKLSDEIKTLVKLRKTQGF